MRWITSYARRWSKKMSQRVVELDKNAYLRNCLAIIERAEQNDRREMQIYLMNLGAVTGKPEDATPEQRRQFLDWAIPLFGRGMTDVSIRAVEQESAAVNFVPGSFVPPHREPRLDTVTVLCACGQPIEFTRSVTTVSCACNRQYEFLGVQFKYRDLAREVTL